MGKNNWGKVVVECVDLEIMITFPDEYKEEFKKCREILEQGSSITRSLENCIKVNHSISLKKQ
jgi:hypothetical protein